MIVAVRRGVKMQISSWKAFSNDAHRILENGRWLLSLYSVHLDNSYSNSCILARSFLCLGRWNQTIGQPILGLQLTWFLITARSMAKAAATDLPNRLYGTSVPIDVSSVFLIHWIGHHDERKLNLISKLDCAGSVDCVRHVSSRFSDELSRIEGD